MWWLIQSDALIRSRQQHYLVNDCTPCICGPDKLDLLLKGNRCFTVTISEFLKMSGYTWVWLYMYFACVSVMQLWSGTYSVTFLWWWSHKAKDMFSGFPPIREIRESRENFEDFFQSGKSGKNRRFSAKIKEKDFKSGNFFLNHFQTF